MAAEEAKAAVEEAVAAIDKAVEDKAVEEEVKKVLDDATPAAKKKFDFILKPLGAVVDAVKGAGSKVSETVGGAFNTVGEKVPGVKSAASALKDGGEKTVKQVGKVADTIVLNVAKVIKAVGNKIPGVSVDEDGAEKAAKIGLSALLATAVATVAVAVLKQKGIIGSSSSSTADEVVEAVEKEVDASGNPIIKKVKEVVESFKKEGKKGAKPGVYVTVTPGDTVRKLAPGLSKEEFLKLNPEVEDINKIKIGQELRIA